MSDFTLDSDALHQALVQRAETARTALEERIVKKLSGESLQQKSGALAASIRSSIADDAGAISIIASSVGVAYAAIQEFGGKTTAHDIVVVKARALKFSGAGEAFAKKVHHPGSTIPAHSFFGGSMSEMRDDIAASLKEAALESLRKD
ncbi:hypothetical protein [Methylocella silvestris]|uniref:Phage protein, HK97 gp10 family n=1 Tax=Methylocella silvestris TaxID=199596 RepID=A0A2J7TFH5_METSI|nr:hypothetical protein [Methylocella silvestris]PNG25509.1 hypothetical protein CR492_13410 [Methylocella silvestris]